MAFAKSADEAFLGGTSFEIMPLVSLTPPVGNGKAGPLTCRLIEAFNALVAKECGTQR